MTRFIRYVVMGLVVVVFQTTLTPGIGVLGQRPDLVVVFAVIAGAFEGATAGSIAGFVVGFLVDIYHPATLGAGTLAGTMAGYVGAKAQELLDLDLLLNQATAFAFARLVHDLIHALVVSLKGEGLFWSLYFGRAIGGAVYTAIVGAAVLSLIGVVRGRKHVVDRR
jgi:rod shape-determining protein MreD